MRLLFSILIIASVIGGLIFFTSPTLKEAKRSKMIEDEIEGLKAEAEKINSENNFLREKIEYLKSDHYKESVAKDRLNLRNMGEKVVVVQPGSDSDSKDGDAQTASDNSDSDAMKNIPNYQKWWFLISNKK